MKFPAMPACTNCGDCCGPVTATLPEVLRIRKQYPKVAWVEHEDPLTCGFYQGGLCRVYEARPAACRMYGVVKEMPCPYFPEAVRISLPAKDAIASGLMNMTDGLLAYYFAADGGQQMITASENLLRSPARINITAQSTPEGRKRDAALEV